jgi:GAF domain-containing protein
LAATFADQAVIAIENVRLFDEVQARTRELAHSVEGLQALGEVTQAVNSTLDLETVLSTIVAKAVQLSGTDAGAIYVFEEAQQERDEGALRSRSMSALLTIFPTNALTRGFV